MVYNRLHLELIRRKLADHAAVFYQLVEFGELVGVSVVNETVRVIVDHPAGIKVCGQDG